MNEFMIKKETILQFLHISIQQKGTCRTAKGNYI